MKTKRAWRNGIGLGQIMALLLLVLPTIAFIMTLIIDYWTVMQIDYKLKLIANYVSEKANSEEDLSTFTSDDRGLCPVIDGNKTTLIFGPQADSNATGNIDITIKCSYSGPYFKDKNISTSIHTYSYHDQNMSITGTCQ
jgi:hypothetical protein